MIKIYVSINIQNTYFKKSVYLPSVPQLGNLLKVGNNSFVVSEVEYNLDFDPEVHVKAVRNTQFHNANDSASMREDLTMYGWTKK